MEVKSVPTMGWTRGDVAATIRLVTQEQRNDIAARIRAEMERQGLDNVRLARKAEVSEKTVSRLINARRDPRYNTLERVAKALGMTESELRGPPPPPLGLGVQAPTLADIDRRLTRIEQTLDGLIKLLREQVALQIREAIEDLAQHAQDAAAGKHPPSQPEATDRSQKRPPAAA